MVQKLVIDCSTGQESYVDLTDQDLADLQLVQQQHQQRQTDRLAQQSQILNLVQTIQNAQTLDDLKSAIIQYGNAVGLPG